MPMRNVTTGKGEGDLIGISFPKDSVCLPDLTERVLDGSGLVGQALICVLVPRTDERARTDVGPKRGRRSSRAAADRGRCT